MSQLPLIAIIGPTASGKTRRAVGLALATNSEIVSADSRQVYRGMDLGTGKDIEEYMPVMNKFASCSHSHLPGVHLIDICPAGYKYNLHEFLRDYHASAASIRSLGHNILLCGGTGMYAEAVLSGMRLPEVPEDPAFRESVKEVPLSELQHRLSKLKKLHNTTDVDTHARAVRALEIELYYRSHPEAAASADRNKAIRPPSVIFMIDVPRDTRRARISERLHARMEAGMDEEVRGLLDSGIKPEDLIYYGLEYKYLTLYVTGHMTRAEMISALETAIHQFAKRQMTWWRGMERRGFTLHHLDYDLTDEEFNSRALEIIQRSIE